MNNITLPPHLQVLYDNSYALTQTDWRKICAIDKAQNLIDLTKQISQKRILDIGAGEGSLLSRLSDIEYGSEYYAVEITQKAIDIITSSNIKNLIEAKLSNGYEIPYPNNFFDLAILSHVVEHLEHPRLLLYEAMRVAKYVFIEVPLEDTLLQKNNFKLNSVGHLNFYSPRTIRFLVQSCNMELIEQKITNPSKRIYKYSGGSLGLAKYYLRELSLKLFKPIAVKIFTYHSTLLCTHKKN